MDIHALYASLLVGLCPFHGYNKSSGRTGGFYHLVCRHGVSTEICNWLLFCKTYKSSLRFQIMIRHYIECILYLFGYKHLHNLSLLQ